MLEVEDNSVHLYQLLLGHTKHLYGLLISRETVT